MPEQSIKEMTAQSSVAIMDRLANALKKLSSAKPAVEKQADFNVPFPQQGSDFRNMVYLKN